MNAKLKTDLFLLGTALALAAFVISLEVSGVLARVARLLS